MNVDARSDAGVQPVNAVLRSAGWLRLAIGFFAMCLVSAIVGRTLLGTRGLGWNGASAGGIGVAFAWVWAYFVVLRLKRGRTWLRALVEALLNAGVIIAVVIAIWGAFVL